MQVDIGNEGGGGDQRAEERPKGFTKGLEEEESEREGKERKEEEGQSSWETRKDFSFLSNQWNWSPPSFYFAPKPLGFPSGSQPNPIDFKPDGFLPPPLPSPSDLLD